MKEEHQVIYKTFLALLKVRDLSKLEKSEQKVFTFVLNHYDDILDNVNPNDIGLLSEGNLCQLLLSMFKEIREKKLVSEENLKLGKMKQAVDECVADIRGTEAKDSFIKFVLETLLLLIGEIKIEPKNIAGSFMSGLKQKIPFLSKDKKEEDESPLTDEEMIIKFLRKVFLSISFSIVSVLIFGPTALAIATAAIGAIFSIKRGVEILFSNDKKGTLYDPKLQDKDDTEKRVKLNGKILEGINDIIKTPVKGVDPVSELIFGETEDRKIARACP